MIPMHVHLDFKALSFLANMLIFKEDTPRRTVGVIFGTSPLYYLQYYDV